MSRVFLYLHVANWVLLVSYIIALHWAFMSIAEVDFAECYWRLAVQRVWVSKAQFAEGGLHTAVARAFVVLKFAIINFTWERERERERWGYNFAGPNCQILGLTVSLTYIKIRASCQEYFPLWRSADLIALLYSQKKLRKMKKQACGVHSTGQAES